MTTCIINFIFKSPIFHVEKENYSENYAEYVLDTYAAEA